MLNNLKKRKISRKRRVLRVRKKLHGTKLCPRMSIFKSNKHLYLQLIDDENGATLAAIGTNSKDFKKKKSKEAAVALGKKIVEVAKEKKISQVIFDRGRYKYHGLIAYLADEARSTGLKF